MKDRIFAAILALVFCTVLPLTGCTKDAAPAESSSEPVSSSPKTTYFDGVSTYEITRENVLLSVKQGKMTVEYESDNGTTTAVALTLGMSEDDFTAAFSASALNKSSDDNYTSYSTGGFRAFFSKVAPSAGLVAILQFGEAYGFEPASTVKADILAVMGTPDSDAAATQKQLSVFYGAAQDMQCLTYNSQNRFEAYLTADGVLSAVLLSTAENWPVSDKDFFASSGGYDDLVSRLIAGQSTDTVSAE